MNENAVMAYSDARVVDLLRVLAFALEASGAKGDVIGLPRARLVASVLVRSLQPVECSTVIALRI